ncbi:hypothetical protein FQA39_LY17549 [Lamprigera yunnana]|nr:hypothetical protein FQA39_LY17549 [Lamprigera yunnana]
MLRLLIVTVYFSIIVEGNTNNYSNDLSAPVSYVVLEKFVKQAEDDDKKVIFQPPKVVNIEPVPEIELTPVRTYEQEVREMEERRRKEYKVSSKNYAIHFAIGAAVSTVITLIGVVFIMFIRKRQETNGMTRLITEA